MSTTPEKTEVSRAIRDLLSRLRWRIRRYVWLHGLSGAVLALGLAFWIAHGIDWWQEPTAIVLRCMLGIAGAVVLFVIYHLTLRRTFVRLTDRSMAVLLERRFGEFKDSLLTAVELGNRSGELADFGREMLSHTLGDANQQAGRVQLPQVFNSGPLTRTGLGALAVVASIVVYALAAPSAFWFGIQRLATLTEEPWPRRTRLTIEGFKDKEAVIAKGSDLPVHVMADLAMEVPQVVQIRFRTDEGVRGRESMTREGNAQKGRDKVQDFRYTFEGILSDRQFDVLGGDARLRDLRIRVVESPTISQMTLHCVYPKYMRRSPTDLAVSGAVQLPRGTQVTIRASANKDLVHAQIDYLVGKETLATQTKELSESRRRKFEFTLPALLGDSTIMFTLLDTDGIKNRDPIRVALTAAADEPPQLNVRLEGIGSAITPQARLPLVGKIEDDYGVASGAIDYTVDETPPEQRPFAHAPQETNEVAVSEQFNVEELALKPGQKLLIATSAVDNFDLTIPGTDGAAALHEGPNVGRGERFLLDVVTREQLLAMLEARELNLRQRFQSIIEEMTEARELLARVEFSGEPASDAGKADKEPGTEKGKEPDASDTKSPAAEGTDSKTSGTRGGDKHSNVARFGVFPLGGTWTLAAWLMPAQAPSERAIPSGASEPDEPSTTPQVDSPQIQLERRLLRIQRAMQASEKDAQETLGIAQAFDGIRAELVNNRLDTEELRIRLKDNIADPLRKISERMFPAWDRQLARLQKVAKNPELGPAERQKAVAQADAILVQMQAVLDKMLELESFNEAVDLLRAIIAAQQKVSEETKKRRAEKVRNLNEDDDP